MYCFSAKSDTYESQREPIKFNPAQSVKDYNQPFYCKICHVDCNSDVMLENHVNGTKHKKKLKQLGNEDPDQVLPANSKDIKNVPKHVSLEHKLMTVRDSNEPVIGLQMIEEVVRASSMENFEPRYRCTLCLVTSEVDPMYQHIIGQKHQKKYLTTVLRKNCETKEDVKYYAQEVDRKERRNSNTIYKIVDDAEYAKLMPVTQQIKQEIAVVSRGMYHEFSKSIQKNVQIHCLVFSLKLFSGGLELHSLYFKSI